MSFPTSKEIVARIEARKGTDMLGFEVSEYLPFLDFDDAKPYLKDGVTAAEWDAAKKPRTREAVLATMLDYMDFAWEKAHGERGISAWRSIAHFQAWLWLVGERDMAEQIADYDDYGKPQLKAICRKFGWDLERFPSARPS